ncbi:unnamed protein product [Blepharisma stoltei]|uniref:Uncharacterized protein n=1 Tax=Blepharisma stoltei TaxID=1481888 RepID=A0AAU9JM86_9CILI|nr:unnamed protein product [Blepharisma stoltei]
MLHHSENQNTSTSDNSGFQRRRQAKSKTVPATLSSARNSLSNKNLNTSEDNFNDSLSVRFERVSFIAQCKSRLIASEPQARSIPTFSTKFLRTMPYPRQFSSLIDEPNFGDISELDLQLETDPISETYPRKLSPLSARVK